VVETAGGGGGARRRGREGEGAARPPPAPSSEISYDVDNPGNHQASSSNKSKLAIA
jgi:hypothetical protein